MKTITHVILLILLSFFKMAFALDASGVYDQVKDSTFMIYSFNVKDKKPEIVSEGSAVAVTSNILITNCHVLTDGEGIAIKIGNDYSLGTLAYEDKKTDLCLVFVPKASFNPVSIRKEQLKIGEEIFTVGSPQEEENIITQGIISGIKQVNGQGLIVIDANIDHGSSGGGLFDNNANLIGITAGAIGDKSQIGYAVPINWVTEIIPTIKLAEPENQATVQNAQPDLQALLPVKIADYGRNDISLYKYEKKCFITFSGHNETNKIVSRAIWFPIAPKVLFFAKITAPLIYVVDDIFKANTADQLITENTQDYIDLNNEKFPLFLVKGTEQGNFVLMANLAVSPVMLFQQSNYFSVYFKSKINRTFIIDFDLIGFTDAYASYSTLCK